MMRKNLIIIFYDISFPIPLKQVFFYDEIYAKSVFSVIHMRDTKLCIKWGFFINL